MACVLKPRLLISLSYRRADAANGFSATRRSLMTKISMSYNSSKLIAPPRPLVFTEIAFYNKGE